MKKDEIFRGKNSLEDSVIPVPTYVGTYISPPSLVTPRGNQVSAWKEIASSR